MFFLKGETMDWIADKKAKVIIDVRPISGIIDGINQLRISQNESHLLVGGSNVTVHQRKTAKVIVYFMRRLHEINISVVKIGGIFYPASYFCISEL